MSFAELIIIGFVAIFALKPEDIPAIARKLGEIFAFFSSISKDFLSYFDNLKQEEENNEPINETQINFYLKRITALSGKYKANYSAKELKEEYLKLLKKEIAIEKGKESDKNTKHSS